MENYEYFEREIISPENRFGLSVKDKKESFKTFHNSNVLITGAAGSIGKAFCKDIINYNFNKIYLLDKNENELTELNRELILKCSKKIIKKIHYICSDLVLINLDDFLKKKKISHYLNFAAIKHVRSEEELLSTKYMFMTNSDKFIPTVINNKYLKCVFSVSTDKTVNPTSLLGVSKSLMEENLSYFKKKNKKIFVSSVRFANVSFSNGSILKYAVDRINKKEIFGIPRIIKRFFITHREASSLCMKSLLERNNGHIIIPNNKVLNKKHLIKNVVIKILQLKKYKPNFIKKISSKNKNIKSKFPVLLTSPNNHGQKYFEEFSEVNEKIYPDIFDKTICKIKLKCKIKNLPTILKKISKFDKINKIKDYLFKNHNSYKIKKKVYKVSRTI